MIRLTLCVVIAAVGCKSSERKAPSNATPAPTASATPAEIPAAPTPAPASYEPLGIHARKVAGGYDVDVVVKLSPGGQHTAGVVKYTAEPLNIAGRVAGPALLEADLLGSGLAFDLDGDGSTTGTVPVACDGDVAVVGDVRLSPVMQLGETATWRYRDGDHAARLGAKGAHAMLYTACSASSVATVGLAPAGASIDVLEIASPALQLLVFEAAGSADAAPTFSLETAAADARTFAANVFEPVVTPSPSWHSARWLMAPLDREALEQTVTVSIRGPSAVRMIVASINQAGAGFDRVRSRVGGLRLEE